VVAISGGWLVVGLFVCGIVVAFVVGLGGERGGGYNGGHAGVFGGSGCQGVEGGSINGWEGNEGLVAYRDLGRRLRHLLCRLVLCGSAVSISRVVDGNEGTHLAAGCGSRRAREAGLQDGLRSKTPRLRARGSRVLGPVACKGAPLPARNAVAINKIKNILFFFLSQRTNECVREMKMRRWRTCYRRGRLCLHHHGRRSDS
jgi:hypothetical protein